MKPEEILRKIEEDKKGMEFLPTGFERLDNLLDGGFLLKELVVLGGFTGSGKSYFSAQILYNLATKGFKSLYFSLEISNETIASRIIGALADIKSTRVRSGHFSKREYENLEEARARFIAYNQLLEFYDDIYKLEEIKKVIRRTKPDFIVVDFIQNIFHQAKDEYSRLSFVSLALQKLAKETNSCILVLSQLSNSAARQGMDTGMLEYKGSGNIATVCDLGFVMQRRELSKFELGLQKNRRGMSRVSFNYNFKRPGGWIYEAEEEAQEENRFN